MESIELKEELECLRNYLREANSLNNILVMYFHKNDLEKLNIHELKRHIDLLNVTSGMIDKVYCELNDLISSDKTTEQSA